MAWLFQALGGVIAMLIVGAIAGLFFKHYDATDRALYAVIAGWLFCSAIAGFGMADGGPYRWDAALIYAPGALAAYFVLRAYYRRREIQEDDAF